MKTTETLNAQIFSQPGLSYASKESMYVTLHLNKMDKESLHKVYHLLLEFVKEVYSHTEHLKTKKIALKAKTTLSETGITDAIICGVDRDLWIKWHQYNKHSIPVELKDNELYSNLIDTIKCSPPYKYTGGDLYFKIKSDTVADCNDMLQMIKSKFSGYTDKLSYTMGNSDKKEMVYGRRLLHGLISNVDPINMAKRVLIGDEDIKHKGGCYAVSQKFIHNWSLIGELSMIDIENMIGRNHKGNILPNMKKQSHLHLVRAKDENDVNYRIYSQGKTFGTVEGDHSKEEGVFVSAFSKNLSGLHRVLSSMLGDKFSKNKEIADKHLRYSSSIEGNIWYIPSAAELGLKEASELKQVEINPFFKNKKPGSTYYYNSKEYLHDIWQSRYNEEFPVSDRVIGLLGTTFSRWHNNWYSPPTFPYLPRLDDYIKANPKKNIKFPKSIAQRKGLAIKCTLSDLFTNEEYCKKMDLFRISADEIIVGVLPPFTLGTGVPVMKYLNKDEELNGFLRGLDETSMAGHIVPDYPELLKKGVGGLLKELHKKLDHVGEKDSEKSDFYNSSILALEGVEAYFKNYAQLAKDQLDKLSHHQKTERENLKSIHHRMLNLSHKPPKTFIDALQLIFGMHCCMHLVGELVSIGRLDKWLYPFFEDITVEEAQEAIDAFWIKMDEKVLMNKHYYEEKRSYGTCAIPYIGGPVPIGDKLSQWVMQVTVGGYGCSGDDKPKEVYNQVTEMCLRAASRLPLNSPCLSLRLTKNTPRFIHNQASKAILTGGAAPFVYNDELIIPSLMDSGNAINKTDASNYCADGCWETILPGQTELALSYVIGTNALEMAINQGSTYVNAGPSFIRGSQVSFLSTPAEDIKDFDQLLDIFYKHFEWMMIKFFDGIYKLYGGLNDFCPSPLLSTLVQDCIRDGRDLTNGGAKYHLLAPQILGVPCIIDSLWAIKTMVFEEKTAVCTLPELVKCLICDWGYDMIAPFEADENGPERKAINALRYKELRNTSLAIPKFGTGNRDVDAFAGKISSKLKNITFDIFTKPESVSPEFAALHKGVQKKYSIPKKKHEFNIIPAFGTFEDYIGIGMQNGASADGRRKASPLSSNMSPMAYPTDLPIPNKERDIKSSLKGWNNKEFKDALKIVVPLDINIPEDFPCEELEDILVDFSKGKMGSNMLTISAADVDTMLKAQQYPEQYDLLRMRMGGWSEFFIAMYDAHQEQHLRRPIYNIKDNND